MGLYRINNNSLEPIEPARFAESGVRERQDLQRMLRESIDIVAPDTMVIAEEFSDWEDSNRRIDLLCLDRDANLVVVELKRTEDGGHMELQALRYAAMVSLMTFPQLVRAHRHYLDSIGQKSVDAQQHILDFLGWDEPQEQEFPNDVRIVLVSANFSSEVTTAVLWLNERDLDIRCVRLSPHKLDGKIVLSVEQCLPLPSAEMYQVRIREKSISRRDARRARGNWTGYWFMNVGDGVSAYRSWEDCRRFGFMLAGGGQQWIRAAKRLQPGDHVLAYVSGAGYVGLGRVTAAAVPQQDFTTTDGKRLANLPLTTPPNPDVIDDPGRCDWCVAVEWIKTFDRENGVLSSRAYRSTVCQVRQADLVESLQDQFGVDEAAVD